MPDSLNGKLIDAAVAAVVDNTDELTRLDQAIGDGDHGLNMRRGFEAIAAQKEELESLDLWPAVQKAGMTLVMKVGGASGPLFGSLLMAIGKTDGTPIERIRAGVEAVKARGKSDVGAKTMLDVLAPVVEALETGADYAAVTATAEAAMEATKDMKATKGRASFLGDRSIGHIDPGARSSQLLVAAICGVLEGEQ
jgi:dihydroxyacetone kinase-like protein